MMGGMNTARTRVTVGGDIVVARDASIDVVATSSTGTDAITQAVTDHPDVLVLDVHIADPDARAVCRRVREWAPDTRVLLVGTVDDEALYSTLVAGADGALIASAGEAEYIAAIRSMHRGESMLPARVASRILHDIDAWAARSADPLYPPPSLTSTERDVLGRLADGVGIDAIAESNDVTPHLVSLHIGFAVGKLHRYVLGSDKIAAYDT